MPIDPITAASIVAGGVKASAWLWEKFGERITDQAFRSVTEKWDAAKWGSSAEAYRSKVKTLYGNMQIMGMTEPVPLENIFTDAYLLDKPTAFSRFAIEHLLEKSADPDPPQYAKRVNGLRLTVEKGNLLSLGNLVPVKLPFSSSSPSKRLSRQSIKCLFLSALGNGPIRVYRCWILSPIGLIFAIFRTLDRSLKNC